jgi:O-succinylbenzoate synthase
VCLTDHGPIVHSAYSCFVITLTKRVAIRYQALQNRDGTTTRIRTGEHEVYSMMAWLGRVSQSTMFSSSGRCPVTMDALLRRNR